jgi:hypothetical protein
MTEYKVLTEDLKGKMTLNNCHPAKTWMNMFYGKDAEYALCIADAVIPKGTTVFRHKAEPKVLTTDICNIGRIVAVNGTACTSGTFVVSRENKWSEQKFNVISGNPHKHAVYFNTQHNLFY